MAEQSVHVRYFAAAAEAAGRTDECVQVVSGATLGDLRAVLMDRHGPRMAQVLSVAAFLQDNELIRDPNAEAAPRVDVLPPFAGG